MTTFPADLFDTFEADPRWLGYGYLRQRINVRDDDPEMGPLAEREALVVAADARVLAYAAEHGGTRETLFRWAISKEGRWFGDAVFGGDEADMDRAINEWGLLRSIGPKQRAKPTVTAKVARSRIEAALDTLGDFSSDKPLTGAERDAIALVRYLLDRKWDSQ